MLTRQYLPRKAGIPIGLYRLRMQKPTKGRTRVGRFVFVDGVSEQALGGRGLSVLLASSGSRFRVEPADEATAKVVYDYLVSRGAHLLAAQVEKAFLSGGADAFRAWLKARGLPVYPADVESDDLKLALEVFGERPEHLVEALAHRETFLGWIEIVVRRMAPADLASEEVERGVSEALVGFRRLLDEAAALTSEAGSKENITVEANAGVLTAGDAPLVDPTEVSGANATLEPIAPGASDDDPPPPPAAPVNPVHEAAVLERLSALGMRELRKVAAVVDLQGRGTKSKGELFEDLSRLPIAKIEEALRVADSEDPD